MSKSESIPRTEKAAPSAGDAEVQTFHVKHSHFFGRFSVYSHPDMMLTDLDIDLVRKSDYDALKAERDAAIAMTARWKSAIEGLTPQGSEYVDDPEACAAAIRGRCRYPRRLIELQAERDALQVANQALVEAASGALSI